jgi:hypothetical protein
MPNDSSREERNLPSAGRGPPEVLQRTGRVIDPGTSSGLKKGDLVVGIVRRHVHPLITSVGSWRSTGSPVARSDRLVQIE